MSGYTMPDGSVHEFASDEIASKAYAAWTSQYGHQLGDPIKEDSPISPYVINKAKQGLVTLPLIADLAGDAVNAPFKYVGKQLSKIVGGGYEPDYFQNTGNLMRSAPDALGYDPNMPVPTDEYGTKKLSAEMLGHIAEFAAGNIGPGGAVVSAAKKPLTALAKETAGVVLAGEGATAGSHLAPKGYETTGEMLGSMTGPLLVQKLIESASKGGNWVSKIADEQGIGVSQNSRISRGNMMAANELRPQLESPVSVQNIDKAGALSQQIPGFKENLTLGQITDSPFIKSRQQHYGSTTQTGLESGINKQAGLMTSINNYGNVKFPTIENVTANQGAIRKFDADAAMLTQKLKTIRDQETQIAAGLPRKDMEALGNEIRDTRNSLMESAKSVSTAKYSKVYEAADKAGLRVNMGDVESLAQGIIKDTGRVFQDEPGIVGKILNRYSQPTQSAEVTFKVLPNGNKIRQAPVPVKQVDQSADFKEFHSLYKEANQEAGQLRLASSMGQADAPQKLREVEKVRDLLKTKLTQMEGPEVGGVGVLLKDANQFYATKYQALFKTGVGGEIGKVGKFGAGTENAKLIDSLIMKPGDASGVREFLQMAQGDTKALQTLHSGVMDKFAKEVVKDSVSGKVSQTAINNFLTKYKEPLELLPQIRQSISTTDQAMRALNASRLQVISDAKINATSVVAKMAKSDTPDKAIGIAMQSPNNMAKLVANSSTDERLSIARLVMERAIKSPNAMEFISKNNGALTAAMGKEQLDALKIIVDARQIAARTNAPTHLAFEKLGDPLLNKIGTSIPQMLSEHKAVTNRFASPEYAASRIAVRWWNKQANEQKDKMIMEAIYNPEMAIALSKYMKETSVKSAGELNKHLIPYGIRTIYESEKPAEKYQ